MTGDFLKITHILIVSIAYLFHTAQADSSWIDNHCPDCIENMRGKTGVYILNHGQDSLLTRAWLTQQATHSIDVQYFIWSTDNIGILASTELLNAANRGVKVRVLVDDLLIDAENQTLLALDAHENVDIKIYNPMHSVGVSGFKRALGLLTGFRASNQRMHDKTAIFDGLAGITGGRNMADEYYDFDHTYNFRDRDVLLLGPAVHAMTENFEEFWSSEQAKPVAQLLAEDKRSLKEEQVLSHYAMLKAYAEDTNNFSPEIRQALTNMDARMAEITDQLVWDHVTFINDSPGKNENAFWLDGGGESTAALYQTVAQAQQSVLIQSPYLIIPEQGLALFETLLERGVTITISTNSLASTDNLMAFSGYAKQRKKLLNMGIKIYEYRPDASVRKKLIQRSERSDTIFAIHAKSLVVDNKKFYIGTFNLDPRSANLNTEVGILAENKQLAEQLTRSIQEDMTAENSWSISDNYNPDAEVPRGKRFKLWLYKLLPMDAVL